MTKVIGQSIFKGEVCPVFECKECGQRSMFKENIDLCERMHSQHHAEVSTQMWRAEDIINNKGGKN